MVIIFHMSISLFRYQPNFKWGINARQRTKYVESFSQTYDQNGDTLSYLIGIGSRGRTSPYHGHGWLHGCCPGTILTQICLHDCFTRLSSWLAYRSHLHIILTWRYTIVTYEDVSILSTPQPAHRHQMGQSNSPSCCTTSNDNLWSSDTLR